MTTAAKKERERQQVCGFLKTFAAMASLEEGEKPDFRIHWPNHSVALEVTEYHSQQEAESGTGRSRVWLEGDWWRHLEPTINELRRASPELKNVHAFVQFSPGQLPSPRDTPVVAEQLVGAVKAVVADSRFADTDEEVTVDFCNRASDLQKVSGSSLVRPAKPADQLAAIQHSIWFDRFVLLASEDWPALSGRVQSLTICRRWFEAPSWTCRNVTGAWVAAQPSEFQRILTEKRTKVQGYDLRGQDLWLLIVCDSFGDLSAHVFPDSEDDRKRIADIVLQTGFDFTLGPFNQVWLYSEFSGHCIALYERAAAGGTP